ncbi:DUF302 domain-containing protein [Oricola cellulosilytica]|uniref:DUF302 domain-containing protein n=1 Tax=Oricola cellulosilytica TaxID=1429082 RepID=A0A4R0P579_9HYPH|nr:DUF302 domain-containing protein [Oricola cellulosilytica]TCD11827.1 DUF302 domain-containing protein [Oricola cellulosilytica]
MTLKFLGAALAGALFCGAAIAAEDVETNVSTSSFEDVSQAVEDAIVNRGYKIDYHGFIGDMLKRTAEDVGAEKQIYTDAEFFTFCSAVISRKVMEVEPEDIAYCPYVVFVYERADEPGQVKVGFRRLPEGGPRDEVNAMLSEIVKEGAEGF